MRDPVVALKHELLAAADRQLLQHAGVGDSRRRWQVSLGRNRVILTAATVAIVAVAALLFTTPWASSPGFLERAEAALTPSEGSILHMKWDTILTLEDPPCSSTTRHEVWIDTAPPHSYRAFVPDLRPGTDQGTLSCPKDRRSVEVGGENGKATTLRFVPPNTLVVSFTQRFYFEQQDAWRFAREAIAEGRAHEEGARELDGRRVELVRFDPPASCPAGAEGHCPTEPEYAYFDAETLAPVQWDWARDPMFPGRRQRERYLVYEYLPRTEANLALTDIRAQHPDALERWSS